MNNSIAKVKTNGENKKISKGCKIAKKVILALTAALCIAAFAAMSVFAAEASGEVDTSTFIEKAVLVLKSVICLIGAGLAIWGVVNLIEGYGSDNPGAKSQGMKQLMAGLGLVLVGLVVVPVLENMMDSATGNS